MCAKTNPSGKKQTWFQRRERAERCWAAETSTSTRENTGARYGALGGRSAFTRHRRHRERSGALQPAGMQRRRSVPAAAVAFFAGRRRRGAAPRAVFVPVEAIHDGAECVRCAAPSHDEKGNHGGHELIVPVRHGLAASDPRDLGGACATDGSRIGDPKRPSATKCTWFPTWTSTAPRIR